MRHTTVTVMLISAISLVATLGFLSIGIMDHGMHMHCPFSFVTGIANCPMTMGPTDGIAHHVATLQGAAKVPVKDIGPVVIPLALLLAFAFFSVSVPVLGIGRDGPSGGIRRFVFERSAIRIFASPVAVRAKWSALHNKRDGSSA